MKDGDDHLERHIDHIKFSYQATIQLLIREGESVWNRFNSILLVNSILLAAISVLITSKTEFKSISLSLISLGVLLCLIWGISVWRGFEQAGHYYHKLIELENDDKLNDVNVISSMNEYREGKEILFDHLNSSRKLCYLPSKLPIKWACMASIFMFLVIYVLMLFVLAFG